MTGAIASANAWRGVRMLSKLSVGGLRPGSYQQLGLLIASASFLCRFGNS
jgi:hypothetical protein